MAGIPNADSGAVLEIDDIGNSLNELNNSAILRAVWDATFIIAVAWFVTFFCRDTSFSDAS